MKAILQRVSHAQVDVDNKTVGKIGKGFLILLGVEAGDDEVEADVLAVAVKQIIVKVVRRIKAVEQTAAVFYLIVHTAVEDVCRHSPHTSAQVDGSSSRHTAAILRTVFGICRHPKLGRQSRTGESGLKKILMAQIAGGRKHYCPVIIR